MFLNHVEAGDADWLKVAASLRAHVDAWPAESLRSSMSKAMMNAPSRVLPLVRIGSFGTDICVPNDFDDSPGQLERAQREIAAVEAMYKRFLKSPLASEAAQCLSALERALEQSPQLRPNTSLERTRRDKVPSADVGVRAAQLNR